MKKKLNTADGDNVSCQALDRPAITDENAGAFVVDLCKRVGQSISQLHLLHRGNVAYLEILGIAIARYPELLLSFALSEEQLLGKAWALDTLASCFGTQLGRVRLVAGWYGVLAAMLLNDRRFRVSAIESVDISRRSQEPAAALCAPWVEDATFKAHVADAVECVYPAGEWDWVINTACEHFDRLSEWWALIPPGQHVLLQSNDAYDVPGHISCVRSIDAFIAQLPLSEVAFSGTQRHGKYHRFMLIGVR